MALFVNSKTLYYIYKDILNNCRQHQFMGMNASIAFFTLFAILPLILLIIFIVGQWLNESSLAFDRLQNITHLLLPEMSERIMCEVKKISNLNNKNESNILDVFSYMEYIKVNFAEYPPRYLHLWARFHY